MNGAVDILGLPLVFKECFGSFGEQVWLCKSKQEIISHITEKPFILQKFIENSAGHDIRIEVVGGRVAAAVRRENKNDFRANVTNGGTMTPYQPTEEEKTLQLPRAPLWGSHSAVWIFWTADACAK